MRVLNLIEYKDGSAALNLELTEEENRLLIEYAIQQLLREKLKKYEGKYNE